MLPITALLSIGGKLIDKLIPDPEAKAKAQLDLAAMAQDGELAKMANDTDQAIFAKAEQHKSAMMAAPDPTSYDIFTGWPRIYGEE